MGFFNGLVDQNYLNIGTIHLWYQSKNCFDVTKTIPNGYLSSYSVKDPNGVAITGSATATFKDTALGYFSSATAAKPNNQSKLDSLTAKFGEDYMDWRSSSFDINFNHILDIDQNGLLDETVWTYRSDECTTRIFTFPPEQDIQELGHYDWSGDCNYTADSCHYYYGPPSICSGGKIILTRYKLCLWDGRLVSIFIDQEAPDGS